MDAQPPFKPAGADRDSVTHRMTYRDLLVATLARMEGLDQRRTATMSDRRMTGGRDDTAPTIDRDDLREWIYTENDRCIKDLEALVAENEATAGCLNIEARCRILFETSRNGGYSAGLVAVWQYADWDDPVPLEEYRDDLVALLESAGRDKATATADYLRLQSEASDDLMKVRLEALAAMYKIDGYAVAVARAIDYVDRALAASRRP